MLDILIPIEAYTARSAYNLAKLTKQAGNARVVVYGTVAAMNPILLSKYFEIVISTGPWYTAIEELIVDEKLFMNKLFNGIYNDCVPMNRSWAYPLLNKLPMEEYPKIMNGQLNIVISG